MPEIRFQIQWPDGSQEICYSPSLVVKDYFTTGESYALEDFLDRSRTALQTASQRVQAKYGFPCSLALGQLEHLESQSTRFMAQPEDQKAPQVRVLAFLE
ncbi:MSMEG_0570 family nitrogen starvation response protein [Leptolyngbya sp. BL0902]|uniref:MSMEG_0570 family nitrogen starvation response protein n=1 Tax=Leptolyngbya sp. BL0902 TaxID=1115757 RepID=UPI0018E8C910|nr:MSMEG_0570 family nitrogen starvation response protein [Leptolyngbya sp. BL0902]